MEKLEAEIKAAEAEMGQHGEERKPGRQKSQEHAPCPQRPSMALLPPGQQSKNHQRRRRAAKQKPVSGSQGQGEDISEARCMADWLIDRGIEPERVWLEEQADNTQENIAAPPYKRSASKHPEPGTHLPA